VSPARRAWQAGRLTVGIIGFRVQEATFGAAQTSSCRKTSDTPDQVVTCAQGSTS
jgi:hypothetical protein